MKTCNECEWFARFDKPMPSCHRNPPLTMLMGSQANVQFQPTQPHWWCGEWTPREEGNARDQGSDT